jgi:hypothetical protein
MTSNKLKTNNEIRKAVIKEFKCIKNSDPLKYLSKGFNRHSHILVTNEDDNEYFVVVHKDLLDYYLKNSK